MVFTLQRYIFRETFKVFILAAVALTLVLSLGSILRPVQEYGAGPRQVGHLMGYFLPITLTFVLPMAALFATSLVYGRFASDNELDACRASGISLQTLVYPGLALAIMVAIANLILSFHVVPAFVHLAEKSLKADAKQILFRNIQRRGYYKVPPDERYLIYADHANPQNNMLSGVIVNEVKDLEIKRIVTAEKAKIRFIPHERFNDVQITAYNAYQMDPDGDMASAEWVPITAEFGSLLGDNIKFKKIDEMKRIRLDPMRFYPVAKLAREAYAQFTVELLTQDIATKTDTDPNDPNNFYKLHSGQKLIEFTADECSVGDEKKVKLSGEVVVHEYDAASRRRLRTLRMTTAFLHIEGDELAPTLTMEMFNPMWQRVDGSQGLAGRQIVRGLVLPRTVTEKFESTDILKAIHPDSTDSALQNSPSPELKKLQNSLQTRIMKTFAEINAELHTRLVFGIGCVSLTMIGIGLGIILKGGHLLSAFGASSLPAAALIVFIMAGKNITKNPGAHAGSGIVLMWTGLILLSLFAAVIYRRLLKH
jgi:lipopolysaccharide export LptBFGC system permease protein LptF